jgi:oligopeptide transport system substrate-binding protein
METFFRSAILGFALLSLTACGKRETKVDAGNRTQSIHIGNLGEPNDLDPHIPDSQNSAAVVMAFFEGLTQYDPKTSQPVPAVAERWADAAAV